MTSFLNPPHIHFRSGCFSHNDVHRCKVCFVQESAWVSIASNNDSQTNTNARRFVIFLLCVEPNECVFTCWHMHLQKHAGEKKIFISLNVRRGERGWHYACQMLPCYWSKLIKLGTVTGMGGAGKVYFSRSGRGTVSNRSSIAAFL